MTHMREYSRVLHIILLDNHHQYAVCPSTIIAISFITILVLIITIV